MFNYYLAKGTKGIISYHTQIDSIDNTTYKLNCPRQIQNIAISNLLEFTNIMYQSSGNMKLKNL